MIDQGIEHRQKIIVSPFTNEELIKKVCAIVEKQDPASRREGFTKRVFSGEPKQARSRCGSAGSVSVAEELSLETGRSIFKATSSDPDGNTHAYLLDEEKDEIVDPAAGQFIPPESRIGFEQYFIGNCFIGPREKLKEICMKGVVNTSTQDDPLKSFQRIWGLSSKKWSEKLEP